jgi:hypothetical protein
MSERCYHSFHETGRCPRCDGEPEQVTRLREALREMIDGEGWGDDTVDDWWKDRLRAALGDTPDE